METSSTSAASAVANMLPEGSSKDSKLRGVDVDDFLKMMIAELQNQDPLNPMDNTQIMEQLGQMRSIESSTQLTNTLQNVLRGQNLSSAGNLLQKNISALSDSGKEITGIVDRVVIEGEEPKLMIQGSKVSLKNIREILPK